MMADNVFQNKITILKEGLSVAGTGSCSATLAGDTSTNNFNLYNSGNTYGVSAFYSGAGFYVRRSTTGGGFVLYNSNQWTGQFYNDRLGIANTTGATYLTIGNNLAKTTDKNAQGILRIYSQNTQYGDLKTDTLTANRTYTLPNKTGTIALAEDLSNYYNKSDSQTQHTVLAAPHDKDGPPDFRLLVAADLPVAAASASGIISASTQTFGGNKTFSGTLTVASGKATSLGGTLSVTGVTTLNNNLDIIVGNNDKFINFYYNTDKTHLASWRLGYLGTGAGNNNYFVLQSGKSSGSTDWNSVLQIGMDNHNITIYGAITLNNTLTVAASKATSLTGTLAVTGATTLNGGLTVAASKATSLTGTLTVTGATTLNGGLTVASDKATSLGGTLTVAGNTTLKGKIIIDNTNNTNYGSSFPTGTETVGQIYFQTIG